MNQKGVVLFTTIMMLSVLTLLVLSLLQAVFLYIKASNQLAMRHQAFYQLEKVTEDLRRSNVSIAASHCIVTDRNANESIHLLKHHQGCDNNHDYDYLITDLGERACLEIESAQMLWSSHHWLLSVRSKESPYPLLQVRVAEAVILKACKNEVKRISEGILSWRYFDST